MFIHSFRKHFALLVVASIFVGGCAVNNNSLKVRDLADCMNYHKVKIDHIKPIEPAMLYADSAMEMKIAGHVVAAYYFNKNLETQKKRIELIEKNKYVYIMGLKFPAIVHGSFVLVNVNSNPKKHEIINAFKKFEIP